MHPISAIRISGIASKPRQIQSTYVKVVGGTTWHWLGTSLRFLPHDFSLSSIYGRGVDWPIGYDDLEPFYGEAEAEIGVSGNSSEPLGASRTTNFPMPPIPQTFLDKAYAAALAGTVYDVRATPQGRNSVDRGDRPACCGNAELHSRLPVRRNTMQRCIWPWPAEGEGRPTS
jgi:choline dehydrogenase-like flavoprotein